MDKMASVNRIGIRTVTWRSMLFTGTFAIALCAGTTFGMHAAPSTRVTKPDNTAAAIQNTMKITDVTYDAVKLKIRVTYQIDNLGFQYRIGFSWIQRAQGVLPLSTDFLEPAASPRVGEIGYTEKLGQANTYEFDFANASPPLEYAQGYYFGGWVSKVEGSWALPTAASMFYYTLPQPSAVQLDLFKNSDIVRAFSGCVVLGKVDPIDTKATLRLVDNVSLAGSGLSPVSSAFKLETNISSAVRILVELQYNGALIPAGATPNDIRMYFYDEARKAWMIETNPIMADPLDAQKLFAERYLSECTHPFFLAVDMVPPAISVTGDSSSALPWGKPIELTVRVNDNIANPRAWLQAGRADSAMQLYKNDVVAVGTDIPWVIASSVVQGECGIRIHAGVNDGRLSAVADISRDVRFTNADGMRPPRNRWIPLSATAVLDTPLVKQVLNEYKTADGAWTYDNFRMRLFRYMKKGWVEYSEANQDLFRFEPGRVLWLKTRNENPIDLGSGRSVSLKSPFGIPLQGLSWTDFCLPYKFDIRIGDILRVNDAAMVSAMQIYRWDRSGKGGRYSLTNFYLPFNGIGKLTDTLLHEKSADKEKVAYTVWNPLPTDNTLWIPGIPLVYSSVTAAAKNTAERLPQWSVAVRSSDPEGDLNAVFCAYLAGGKGTITYPQAPAWSAVSVGILDRSRQEVCGNVITREIANGGYTYELIFDNRQPERTRVSYSVHRLIGDRNVEIAVIDPKTGAVAPGESALDIEIPANGREYRMLAIGSGPYIQGLRGSAERSEFAVNRITPNPFRAKVMIEYTVPYGPIERIRYEIIDGRGCVVWSARTEGSVLPGRNSMVWIPDRLASGAYIFRLTGYDGRGNKFGEKLAKITYLP